MILNRFTDFITATTTVAKNGDKSQIVTDQFTFADLQLYFIALGNHSNQNIQRRFNGSYWFAAENELGSIQSPPTHYKLKVCQFHRL